MPIRVFNNIASLNAQRILGQNNDRLAQSVERIASGIRVNRGADDAAGLAISEALRSDIRALRQGIRNANDGISLINVAEGALNEQSSILIRLRELSSQAATGTVGSTERATIQLEFAALRNEVDRIAATAEFNGQKLGDVRVSNGGFCGLQVFYGNGLTGHSPHQPVLHGTDSSPRSCYRSDSGIDRVESGQSGSRCSYGQNINAQGGTGDSRKIDLGHEIYPP